MDVILREIDAEIEKLKRIRNIVEGLATPVQKKRVKSEEKLPLQEEVVLPEPTLVVLPPKQKREYHRRPRVLAEEPRALASVIPQRPVFIPKAEIVVAPAKPVEFDPDALEAILRQRLLGGAA